MSKILKNIKDFFTSKIFILSLVCILFFIMDNNGLMVLYPLNNENFNFFQIFTSSFSHIDIRHLISNLSVLLTVGYIFEKNVDNETFFITFLISSPFFMFLYANTYEISILGISGFTSASTSFFIFHLNNQNWWFILLKSYFIFLFLYSLINFHDFPMIAHEVHFASYTLGYLIHLRKKYNN